MAGGSRPVLPGWQAGGLHAVQMPERLSLGACSRSQGQARKRCGASRCCAVIKDMSIVGVTQDTLPTDCSLPPKSCCA